MSNRNSAVLEHILYEFEMYLDTFDNLVDLGNQKNNLIVNMHEEKLGYIQFEINKTIESHELHLRNMMEFFHISKPQNHPNDLRVYDIMNNGNNFIIAKNKRDFDHISKSVGHLTKDRMSIDKNDTIKYIRDYYVIFKQNIKDVVENLEDNIHQDFANEIQDASIQKLLNTLKSKLK